MGKGFAALGGNDNGLGRRERDREIEFGRVAVRRNGRVGCRAVSLIRVLVRPKSNPVFRRPDEHSLVENWVNGTRGAVLR